MFTQVLYREIFLVPIVCGFFIQCLKFLVHLVVGKNFNLGKLLQADGIPNLHSAVFSSLSTCIGLKYGLSSILFSLVTVYSVIIIHDTMRLKGEKGKQVTVLNKIISSSETYRDIAQENELRALRFRPLDVMCGTAFGIIGACILLEA
jgi:acid phosphatase family membrane protein YuiD